MKLKTITVGKAFKIGLAEFSNITSNCHLTYELGENEEPNWDQAWDAVNWQLESQCRGIEPNWIKSNEYSKYFKLTIKVPKEGVNHV